MASEESSDRIEAFLERLEQLSERLGTWALDHEAELTSDLSYGLSGLEVADVLLALELANELLQARPRFEEIGRDLGRVKEAERVFHETGNPRAAVRALGLTKRRGQQYDPEKVVELYRRMTKCGGSFLLLKKPLEPDEPLTDEKIKDAFDPPIEPCKALSAVRAHFGFNSDDACWQYLQKHGVPVTELPSRRTL